MSYMYDILNEPMLEARLINFELHIIPCLSSIQIIGRLFLNPYLSCFLYVCNACFRWFIFQVIKKNSSAASVLNSYNFTILRSVFYSRNVWVSNPNQTKNISHTFIHNLCCFFFSSSPWGVLFFSHESSVFGSKESVWSEITNPFLDTPKKRTLCWGYIYMTQWPNDVMVRHGATCMAVIFNWIAISESCAKMHRLDNQNATSAFKTARTGIVCKKVNNYDNLHGSYFWNFQHCTSIMFYASLPGGVVV